MVSLKRQERQSTPLRRMTVPSAIWIFMLDNFRETMEENKRGQRRLWVVNTH